MSSVVVLEAAQDEIVDAARWYAGHRAALGRAFLSEIDRAILAIGQAPHAFRASRGGYRRYVLPRFSYQLLYRLSGDTVIIVGCLHRRRGGKAFRSGLREAPLSYVATA